MSINNQINWDDPEAVEKMLAAEGLWDIKSEFSNDWVNEITGSSVEQISKIEDMLGLNIQIIEDTESIICFKEWAEVWRLEVSEFNNGLITWKRHLYKSVSIHERWKWIGTAMFNVFLLSWFNLPKTEYTEKKSWLGFLLSTWKYKIVGKVEDDGYITDIDEIEIYEKLSNHKDDDELWITIKLEL